MPVSPDPHSTRGGRGWRRRTAALAVLAAGVGCGAPAPDPMPTDTPLATLEARIRRFAPVDLSADIGALPAAERRALGHLVAAARLMDGLFLEQVWAGNASLLLRLAADPSPEGAAERRYFLINKGPWSRLDADEPFLAPSFGVSAKPPQANFYPADATRDEVAAWFASLAAPAQDEATGFFTTIRRDAQGRLSAVPYSVEYRNTLLEAARHLRLAAAVTADPSLRRYLALRADAFLSNDYFDSDVAWMELESAIEPTIGPYETYEDAWFGYKAAFEAFITLRDDRETGRLAVFSAQLQGLEDALPVAPQYRNPRLGALAPIRVVNVVLTAGDANRGVQTAAFNLPNDDRVIRQKGSKRVMLKNVQEAKFRQVLQPIAAVALSPADRNRVSFEAFFTHILMHELMHGLGPQQVHGTSRPVRQALADTYAPIEEAKADISGLWALHTLADKGVVPASVARAMYHTFLASTFRSIRFGLNSAHGRGIAIQLNYLLDRGAVVVAADGTFGVEESRIRGAVADLTRDLLTMQAVGDETAARDLLARLAVIRPEVQRILDRLTAVPVDIAPRFVSAEALQPGSEGGR